MLWRERVVCRRQHRRRLATVSRPPTKRSLKRELDELTSNQPPSLWHCAQISRNSPQSWLVDQTMAPLTSNNSSVSGTVPPGSHWHRCCHYRSCARSHRPLAPLMALRRGVASLCPLPFIALTIDFACLIRDKNARLNFPPQTLLLNGTSLALTRHTLSIIALHVRTYDRELALFFLVQYIFSVMYIILVF